MSSDYRINVSTIYQTVKAYAGDESKINLAVDPFSKNNKVKRFFQELLNLVSGGKYGEALHQKKEEMQKKVEEVRLAIKEAILQSDWLDKPYDHADPFSGYLELEIKVDNTAYSIREWPDGSLTISEGYNHKTMKTIPDFTLTDLVQTILDEEELAALNAQQESVPAAHPAAPLEASTAQPVKSQAPATPTTARQPLTPEPALEEPVYVPRNILNNRGMEDPLADTKQFLAEILGVEENGTGQYQHLRELGGSRSSGASFVNDLPTARTSGIPIALKTIVAAPDRTSLPASLVHIAGVPTAISSQHPLPAHLETHLQMMMEKKPSALVVLSSDQEMAAENMPDFFSHDGQYGDITVTSKYINSTTYPPLPANALSARNYEITLDKGDGKPVTIPVKHVPHWNDYATQNGETQKALAEDITTTSRQTLEKYLAQEDSDVDDADKMLPMIMSETGSGRCGEVIAACALINPLRPLSLQTIVTDIRDSSSYAMVNNKGQMDAMVDLAMQMGKPVFDS